MKQKTFEKILQLWKDREVEQIRTIPLPKTNTCLSFTQFEADNFTLEQQEHINQCAYCARMSRLFKRYKEEILTVPQERTAFAKPKSLSVRILERIKGRFRQIRTNLVDIVTPIPVALRVAIPIMIVAVILFLSIPWTQRKYADLVQIEPLYYRPIEARGEESLSETERLFQQGMAFYQQGDYGSAINKLLLVIKSHPEDVNANFYVGLCYLLIKEKEPDRAIFYLQKVIELKGEFLFEKCYWYLGNAYLLKDEGKKALDMFEKVVAMEGDYEWEARAMVEKISNK